LPASCPLVRLGGDSRWISRRPAVTENDSRADRNLLTTFAILPPAIGRTRVDAERQNPRGRFGSTPFVGATCKPPLPLRSSRLVRTDFSPVLIYMRAARAHGFLPSKVSVRGGSNDCIRAFSPRETVHFSSQLLFWQGTAAFWLVAVSAQNPHQKKIICGRRNIRTSCCPLVIVEGHSRWTPCSGRAHRLRNRSPRFIRAR